MKQGRTLIELATELKRQSEAKIDLVADTKSISLSLDATSLSVQHHSFNKINDTAHQQLGTHVEIPRKYYQKMQAKSPTLLSDNVNHWLHTSDKRRMVRTLDSTFRAFLSDKYRRIDNDIVANMALDTLLSMPQIDQDNIASCQVTDRRLYLKVVFPHIQNEVKKGDVVESGITISNSEIGQGGFNVMPFVHRLVCLNGMTVNDAALKARHLGKRLEDTGDVIFKQDTQVADNKALMLKLRDTITASADQIQFDKYVMQMRQAVEGEKIVKPVEAVEVLSKSFGLNDTEKTNVLESLIGGHDYSKWGALNAVTSIANDSESYDRATELETMGGKILTLSPSDWHSIATA